jgi:hypothetical protein
MSTWTHVSGILSCDVFVWLDPKEQPHELLEKIVGHYKYGWYDPGNIWESAIDKEETYGKGPIKTPEGSENPLKFRCFTHSTKSCCHNGMIVFWGDLRHYESEDVEEELIPWFQQLVERLNTEHVSIREGSIIIDTEGTTYKTVLSSDYDGDKSVLQSTRIRKLDDERV